jgi:hypothetical protein
MHSGLARPRTAPTIWTQSEQDGLCTPLTPRCSRPRQIKCHFRTRGARRLIWNVRRLMSAAGGSPQSPACLAARDWMVRYYPGVIMALRYYTDKEVPRHATPGFDCAKDALWVSHVRGCASCVDWLRGAAGEQIMEQQRHLAQYCCPQMFSAVETPKTFCRVQLAYDYKNEAQRWYLNTERIINYCPWCGTRLPDGPFVQDGN